VIPLPVEPALSRHEFAACVLGEAANGRIVGKMGANHDWDVTDSTDRKRGLDPRIHHLKKKLAKLRWMPVHLAPRRAPRFRPAMTLKLYPAAFIR
jgi:hypothetical protein